VNRKQKQGIDMSDNGNPKKNITIIWAQEEALKAVPCCSLGDRISMV
jgi:hypothetical protein